MDGKAIRRIAISHRVKVVSICNVVAIRPNANPPCGAHGRITRWPTGGTGNFDNRSGSAAGLLRPLPIGLATLSLVEKPPEGG